MAFLTIAQLALLALSSAGAQARRLPARHFNISLASPSIGASNMEVAQPSKRDMQQKRDAPSRVVRLYDVDKKTAGLVTFYEPLVQISDGQVQHRTSPTLMPKTSTVSAQTATRAASPAVVTTSATSVTVTAAATSSASVGPQSAAGMALGVGEDAGSVETTGSTPTISSSTSIAPAATTVVAAPAEVDDFDYDEPTWAMQVYHTPSSSTHQAPPQPTNTEGMPWRSRINVFPEPTKWVTVPPAPIPPTVLNECPPGMYGCGPYKGDCCKAFDVDERHDPDLLRTDMQWCEKWGYVMTCKYLILGDEPTWRDPWGPWGPTPATKMA